MKQVEAARLIEKLQTPVAPRTDSWGKQFIEYARAESSGTADDQASALQELFSVSAPDASRLLMIERLEKVLLPVLAKAMKKSVASLKSTLHRGRPAFACAAPLRAEAKARIAPPSGGPSGWKHIGGFRVFGGALVLGEYPDADENEPAPGGNWCLVRPARDGVWFVWFLEDEEGVRWIAAHESVAARVDELSARCVLIGEVMVHGGSTSAVDAEVRHDRDFLRDLEYGESTGRSFTASLGGDGSALWSGVEQEGCLVLVSTCVDISAPARP